MKRERIKESRAGWWYLCLLAAMMVIMAFPSAGFAAKKKTGEKPVKLLIVDLKHGSEVRRVRRMFAKYGAKVTWVRESKKIKTSKYDGLLLPGGFDVDPSFYGEENTASKGTNTSRDQLAFDAIEAFVKAKKPIFGICAGAQLLNVYFGGTLEQHIQGGKHKGLHSTRITNRRDLLYGTYTAVTSYHSHHQTIKKLGKKLIVTQRDRKTRMIEGICHKTLPIYGMQWHPERSSAEVQKAVANSFLEIVKLYKTEDICIIN